MEYYCDRIAGILEALRAAARTDRRPVTGVKKKEIGYGQRATILEDTGDWEEFGRFDTWGGREVHACFRAKISIPEEWEGKTVCVTLQTGVTDIWNTDNPQFLLYLNGRMICGQDMNHNEVVLTDCAKAGEVFDYGLYAYSNSRGRDVFLLLDAAVVQPDVERLYYDMKVPFDVARLLKKDDLRREEYFRNLNEAVNLLDLRSVGSEAFYESVRRADLFLRDLYYREKDRESEVTVHSIGHTHIDVAWKWPLRQTREKVLRSFATVLYEMERYPEYRFLSSQPQLYRFVKEDCPELYEKIRERVAEGRWETEGAMWLEADCNLSSGESLIRQILYGKRFFAEEFGKGDNKVLWLPDVFGYSAAMPQILKKSGIRYFMTTKIGWNEYNKIPNDTMLWQGIDGTEILTYFITTRDYITDPELYTKPTTSTTYNGRQNASQVMGTWQRYQNKDLNREVLTCFGHGDGGGGATIEMLEESRRMEYALPACPKVKQTFAGEFFRDLEERLVGKEIPRWVGELYLEFHRGTYTSMARNKRYNRRSEFRNQDAESFAVFARLAGGNTPYPREELRHVWELTLLNQFHDILPGSSIKEVYEDSREQYEELLAADDRMIDASLTELEGLGGRQESPASDGGDTVRTLTLYNTTSFARTDAVESEGRWEIYDGGTRLTAQYTEQGTTVWRPEPVPQKGFRTFVVKPMPEQEETITAAEPADSGRLVYRAKHAGEVPFYYVEFEGKYTLSTPFYHVVFDEAWEFSSLYEERTQRELLQPGQTGNALLAFEDRPKEYDCWNIDPYYREKCWRVREVVSAEVVENGDVRTVLRVKKRFERSEIVQDIVFYAHSPRIDFKTRIDWKESQVLLKTAFPLDLVASKATYEIQYGNVERPTHENTSWEQAKFEVCAHKWADLAEGNFGVALLNDCKYGYDIHGSVMRLTLLKSGIFPNPEADREVHEFTYALYPHEGDFRRGGVVAEAYRLNCPMYERRGAMAEMAELSRKSYVSSSEENVVIETVKPAEENEDLIVRLYEAHGQRTRAVLSVAAPLAAACGCDLMEHPEEELEVNWDAERRESALHFEIRPYEIRTFRLTLK